MIKLINLTFCYVRAIHRRLNILYFALLLEYDLIVSPDSVNLIKELNNYSWSDKKSETPIDAHNHIIDAIRYAVTHALTEKKREISFGWD